MTPAAFKRSIRDLQVWCSSCMVAFAGADPIGVLIGAKRRSGTLVHRIAVHPDHQRQGHGRHLLESLGSKLAILGPPRIVAEVPEALHAACRQFEACGYVQEAVLTDYVFEPEAFNAGLASDRPDTRWMIPVTVDDLAANGLLRDAPQVCWERAAETLTARKHEIEGLALASDERIEAYVLSRGAEIVALQSVVDDGGVRLGQLLSGLRARAGSLALPKVHPHEIGREPLEALGFRPAGRHLLYATNARTA
jgi:hypothetical protein